MIMSQEDTKSEIKEEPIAKLQSFNNRNLVIMRVENNKFSFPVIFILKKMR